MILIQRNNNDPFFNIAAEEHFLKNYDDDIIMFWQSTSSVIVGKHQNTMAEVNLNFINKNNIPVIRRISGGGTVYHDEGNINYTIITSSKNREQLIDFKTFTKPIIGFMESIGLKAVFEGKNNLTIGEFKFSGNSAHVHKNRILNHGTLLFNTNLDNLEKAITPGSYGIYDKAVKSVRANVKNLCDHLNNSISIEDFFHKLNDYFIKYFKIKTVLNLSLNDINEINQLVETKYKLWEWNYGYSPSFNFTNKYNGIELSMDIKKGIIARIIIDGAIESRDEVCVKLLNIPYKKDDIGNIINHVNPGNQEFQIYMFLLGLGDI